MKKILVIAAALLVSAASFAQESNRDANGKIQYGPYETNKFWDNWFVGVGAGVNFAHDEVFAGKGKYAMGLNVNASVGKWIDPCYGIRVAYQGINSGLLEPKTNMSNAFHYAHADFLLNASHLFAGYKETRTVNFVPFIGAGCVFGADNAKAFGLNAGLQVPIRLGGVVSIVPEIGATGTRGVMMGGVGFSAVMSASLGLQFNLGKNNWTRKATTVAAAAAALAASEAAANALKSQNEKLAADAADAAAKANALAGENESLKKALADAQNKCQPVDLGENPIYAYFEIGKTKLSALELAHVDYQVKTALAQNKDVKLTITGNADSKTGSKKRNAYLSQKRAEYLYNLLVEKYGLNADNFTVKSNGGNDIFSNPVLNRAAIISK